MDKNKSIFETLFEINVNGHTEKKNERTEKKKYLTYLSWQYA